MKQQNARRGQLGAPAAPDSGRQAGQSGMLLLLLAACTLKHLTCCLAVGTPGRFQRSLTGTGMRILPTLDAVASALVGDSPALANTLRCVRACAQRGPSPCSKPDGEEEWSSRWSWLSVIRE